MIIEIKLDEVQFYLKKKKKLYSHSLKLMVFIK